MIKLPEESPRGTAESGEGRLSQVGSFIIDKHRRTSEADKDVQMERENIEWPSILK